MPVITNPVKMKQSAIKLETTVSESNTKTNIALNLMKTGDVSLIIFYYDNDAVLLNKLHSHTNWGHGLLEIIPNKVCS